MSGGISFGDWLKEWHKTQWIGRDKPAKCIVCSGIALSKIGPSASTFPTDPVLLAHSMGVAAGEPE